eukprot:12412592-Alexandrium_andersonii.AAC.1
MSASLVGSEMCIRDSGVPVLKGSARPAAVRGAAGPASEHPVRRGAARASPARPSAEPAGERKTLLSR